MSSTDVINADNYEDIDWLFASDDEADEEEIIGETNISSFSTSV